MQSQDFKLLPSRFVTQLIFFQILMVSQAHAVTDVFAYQLFNGSPHTVVHQVNFQAPLLLGYSIVVENGGGGPGKSNRVTAIQIVVNGQTVFNDSEFHGKSGFSLPVSLMSQNQMTISVHGRDLSFVKLKIVGEQALPPVPVISIDPNSGMVPLTSSFSAVGSYDPNAGSITSYQWDFGDGGTATDIIAHHTYTQPGTYDATLTVTNNYGLSASTSMLVTVMNDTVAPYITVTSPESGSEFTTLIIPVSGTSNEPLAQLTVNGMQIPLGAGGLSFSGIYTSPNDGSQSLTFAATDLWGNTSTTNVAIFIQLPEQVPPDPATLAPALPQQEWTSTIKQIEFLYTGPDAIQTGVTPGTISELTGAALRGRIVAVDGTPIKGVKVSALNHPEFGQTLSRVDGYFDFVFNVTNGLMLQFEKEGFFKAQRQADVNMQVYGHLDDIVLSQRSMVVATVALGTGAQVAQGETVTDEDGSRTAGILLPPNTTAQITLPNGTVQSLGTLSLRISELSQGRNAVNKLPAPLPARSGYTYAVDISADEATAAGTDSVVFNRPVFNYVEDFLGVPPGTLVPSGVFNYQTGKWDPASNGVAIRILSISNGMAIIDADGSGSPASVALMTRIGYTSEEAQAIATTYEVGKTYWRMPINHLSVYAYGFVVSGLNMEFGAGEAPKPLTPPGNPQGKVCGSIIDPQVQSVGESVPVFGSPLSLNYNSSRTPAYFLNRSYSLKLTNSSVNPNLIKIVLNWKVAGRTHMEEILPTQNLVTNFSWDGLDAFGRAVQSSIPGEVTVTYHFRSSYLYYLFGSNLSNIPYGLGVPLPNGVYTQVDRTTATLSRTVRFNIDGAWTPKDFKGWSLSAHHYYDGRNLFLGTGETITGQEYSSRIVTHYDPGSNFSSGPIGVAPDGTVFLSTWDNSTGASSGIQKLDPSGSVSFVYDDGYIDRLTSFDSNTLYKIGHNFYDRNIYKITNGSAIPILGFGRDENHHCEALPCPAAEVLVGSIEAMAVDRNGDIYYSEFAGSPDALRSVIRRISNGIVYNLAGGGWSTLAEGADALGTRTYTTNLVVDRDSNVYFVDNLTATIWRINKDGTLHHFGGGGSTSLCSLLDGANISEAFLALNFYGYSLIAASDGSLLLNARLPVGSQVGVWHISPTGVAKAVTGVKTGCNGSSPFKNGQFAVDASEYGAAGIDSFGNIYTGGPTEILAHYNIKKILPALPNAQSDTIKISSPSGSEYFIFDRSGRHLETRSTLTGALKYKFDYDGAGYLSAVHDIDDNITTIDRSGNSISITTPDGVVTNLAIGSDDYLASVSNTQGESYTFTYYTGGLLNRFNRPNGTGSTMTYTSDGLLTRDQDDRGGYTALLTSLAGSQVNLSTAGGLSSNYGFVSEAGNNSWTYTDSAGLPTQVTKQNQIVSTSLAPDGSATQTTLTADPRFGLPSVYGESQSSTTPGGLTFTSTRNKTAQGLDLTDVTNFTMLTDTTNINGNRIYSSIFDRASRTWTNTSPEGRTQVMSMNEKEKISQTQTGTLTPVNFSYDLRGRLAATTQGPRITSMTYDSRGFVDTVTNPLNQTTRFTYDVAGRVLTQQLPDNRVIGYTYDSNGNLTSVTPPGRPQHNFFYDVGDLLGLYTPPTVGSFNPSTTYNYDLDKRLTSVVKPGGLYANYTYAGPGGKLSRIDTNDRSILTTYDSAGRIATESTSQGIQSTYTYDGPLLVNTTHSYNGSVYGSVGATYNNNFQVSAQWVNGTPIYMTYDRDGLLTQINSQFSTERLTYNANGQLITKWIDGFTMTYGYNSFGELTSYSASSPSTNYLSYTLVRDDNGKIISKTESVQGAAPNTNDYLFDSAGRLVEVKTNGVSRQVNTYDSNSNRISYVRKGPTGLVQATILGNYDDQDRIINWGTTNYTFNENGDITGVTTPATAQTLVFDVFGNIKTSTRTVNNSPFTFNFIMDARNKVALQFQAGTLATAYLYDGQKLVGEVNNTGVLRSRYVYGSMDHSPDFMIQNGVTYAFIHDHLGSPRFVVRTSDGAIMQTLNFEGTDAYGTPPAIANGNLQPFRFAGGLSIVGFIDGFVAVKFGARVYDPGSGRWASKDPILFGGGDSNLYGYAMNDPVNFIDPTGLYGTRDCSYYDNRCQGSGGDYYCRTAPYWCGDFWRRFEDPNKDKGWVNCVRQCLQDADSYSSQNQMTCNLDSNTDDFWDRPHREAHVDCYYWCATR